MNDNQYNDGEDETAEAQDRINRILSGGAQSQPEGQTGGYQEDPLGGSDEALSRAQLRSRSARAALGLDQESGQPAAFSGRAAGQPSARGMQALAVFGGVLVLGVLVVVAIFFLGSLAGGKGSISLPFFATATPTPTNTPTPMPTPTPTKIAPKLDVPKLECVYTSEGCLKYCQDPANTAACQGAKDYVKAQGANPDVWFQCAAPASGQPEDAQKCLEEAWRANNP